MRPSMHSRSRSAWPTWRAYSSTMCTMTSRTSTSSPSRSTVRPKSSMPSRYASAKATSRRQDSQASSTTAGSATAPLKSRSRSSSLPVERGRSWPSRRRRNQLCSTLARWRRRPEQRHRRGRHRSARQLLGVEAFALHLEGQPVGTQVADDHRLLTRWGSLRSRGGRPRGRPTCRGTCARSPPQPVPPAAPDANRLVARWGRRVPWRHRRSSRHQRRASGRTGPRRRRVLTRTGRVGPSQPRTSGRPSSDQGGRQARWYRGPRSRPRGTDHENRRHAGAPHDLPPGLPHRPTTRRAGVPSVAVLPGDRGGRAGLLGRGRHLPGQRRPARGGRQR